MLAAVLLLLMVRLTLLHKQYPDSGPLLQFPTAATADAMPAERHRELSSNCSNRRGGSELWQQRLLHSCASDGRAASSAHADSSRH